MTSSDLPEATFGTHPSRAHGSVGAELSKAADDRRPAWQAPQRAPTFAGFAWRMGGAKCGNGATLLYTFCSIQSIRHDSSLKEKTASGRMSPTAQNRQFWGISPGSRSSFHTFASDTWRSDHAFASSVSSATVGGAGFAVRAWPQRQREATPLSMSDERQEPRWVDSVEAKIRRPTAFSHRRPAAGARSEHASEVYVVPPPVTPARRNANRAGRRSGSSQRPDCRVDWPSQPQSAPRLRHTCFLAP